MILLLVTMTLTPADSTLSKSGRLPRQTDCCNLDSSVAEIIKALLLASYLLARVLLVEKPRVVWLVAGNNHA